MAAIGVAILLRPGNKPDVWDDFFRDECSRQYSAAYSVYGPSIFLLHRFRGKQEEGAGCSASHGGAVKQSVGSVLSSGLTTVSGFMALVLMQFKIGPDMGWVMAKAIVLSLICVLQHFCPRLRSAVTG